jgi:hypothetical protein
VFDIVGATLLRVRWPLAGAILHLHANFAPDPARHVGSIPGEPFFESDPGIGADGDWPGYGIAFSVEDAR